MLKHHLRAARLGVEKWPEIRLACTSVRISSQHEQGRETWALRKGPILGKVIVNHYGLAERVAWNFARFRNPGKPGTPGGGARIASMAIATFCRS
jgi:hypothetical protein